MNNLISGPPKILHGLPMSWILLAYSPVIVAAVVMVIGAIVEAFQHLNKND